MNKFILIVTIILFLILSCEDGNSQIYIPLPDSGIVWRQTSTRFDQSTSTQICWDNQFELRGEDTTINGNTYSKLFYIGTYGPNGVCDFYSVNTVNDWAIREDASKKIFIYQYISGQEYLLYDFNLGLNDTLPTGFAYCFHGIYDNSIEVITSIDSVLIDNVYHKAYTITSTNWMGVIPNYVQLIEGIGSTFGLFADNSPNWAEKYDFLNCVHLNGQVIYFQTQPCSLLTSDDGNINVANIKDLFEIFPNPSDGWIQVKSILSNETVCNYKISNSLGIQVAERQIKLSEKASIIDLSSIPEGMYYLNLMPYSLNKSKKFTIIH